MSELDRTSEEKRRILLWQTEVALNHSNFCNCGVCRFVFPETAQCDTCGAWDLQDNMTACFTMSVGGEVDHYLCGKCSEGGLS